MSIIVQTIFTASGVMLGALPMLLICAGTIALGKGLCTAWDYRGLRSQIEVDNHDEEEDRKPKWICTKCHTKNPTSARMCQECGKYK